MFYLDTSAWLKRYELEMGSDWVERFWQGQPSRASSPLGLIELVAAIVRRHAGQAAPADVTDGVLSLAAEDYAGFTHVDFDAAVEAMALGVARKHHLRGADAIHLASALRLEKTTGEDVTLIASDEELLAAAKAEGLEILDPRTAGKIGD